jgi:glucosamine--fructose-6-phosphate aminotransferase (isomerizing)
VLVLASADQHLAKTAANAGEVRAHGGYVIALAEASCSASLGHAAHEVVALPGKGLAQMFAQAVAVQLIAYHTALALGRDIDRPRNLAVA